MADASANRPDSGFSPLPTVATTTLQWWTGCWLAPLQLSIALMDAVLAGGRHHDTTADVQDSVTPNEVPVEVAPVARPPSVPAIRRRAQGSLLPTDHVQTTQPGRLHRIPPIRRIVTEPDFGGEVDYVD